VYRPAVNAVDEREGLDLLRRQGFGHLVTVGPEGLDAVALPFLIDALPDGDDVDALVDRGDADDGGVVVLAHVARANPIWRAAPCPALLIVAPVDAYVSPNWYPTKADDPRVVPTWNYELVHVHGTARARHDHDWLLELVARLTARHEAALPERWSLEDTPADFIDRMLGGIVGIELQVTRIEAKRKLSQNRSDADVRGVIEGLASIGGGSAAVADAMRAATRSAPARG
jgi:transcriptional regulator